MPAALRVEREAGPFEQPFTDQLRESFHVDLSGYPHPAPSKTVHALSLPWLYVLASPLIFVAAFFVGKRERRIELFILCFVGIACVVQNTCLSSMPNYRYLQPVTFPLLVAFGILAGAWLERCQRGKFAR